MIIVGPGAWQQDDGTCANLVAHLVEKYPKLSTEGWNGRNMLHMHASRVGT